MTAQTAPDGVTAPGAPSRPARAWDELRRRARRARLGTARLARRAWHRWRASLQRRVITSTLVAVSALAVPGLLVEIEATAVVER